MKTRFWLIAGALAAVGVQASTSSRTAAPRLEAVQASEAADRVPLRRSGVPVAGRGSGTGGAVAPTAAAPSVEDVGDPDSFGRNVTWLGVEQMNIDLVDTCPTDPILDYACEELAPWPATTHFELDDVASIVLPKKASKTILCHWFSPYLQLNWNNPGGATELGTLYYQPTLTIENPLLDDPALINPMTGLPFGGVLETSMSSTEQIVVPLAPGMSYFEVRRDTATCIAGFVTKRNLVGSYGLTESQANQFFKEPMTIRMNIRGHATHLASMNAFFGLRVMGD